MAITFNVEADGQLDYFDDDEKNWCWNILQVCLILMNVYIIFGSLSLYAYKNIPEEYLIYFWYEN